MIKKSVGESSLKAQLLQKAKDRIHTFLLADKTVRGTVIRGNLMIREMRANHELGILETLVLGHAYLGCGLMSAVLKGKDRIQLEIDCSGPIRGLKAEANAMGEVRGYLFQKPIPLEAPLENFNLSPFFGAGFLTVTKHLEDAKQPFTGQIVLEYGNLAQDLAAYFVISEQIPTAFSLSIDFDPAGNVRGAGGLLLQAMPDATKDILISLENRIAILPSLGSVFSSNINVDEWITETFHEYSPQILANRRIEFYCHCSREMIRSFLAAMPIEELKDMLQKDDFPIETHCRNCNTAYSFSKADIEQLLEEHSKTS
jgi:molecular chaperone Hsp33